MSHITKINYPRRLLLHTPLFYQPPAPTPNYQQYPSSSFDADVVMVLSVLLCVLICSLFVNSVVRCLLQSSSLITSDEPNHVISMVKQEVNNGVDKRALRTFQVLKYSSVQGLNSLDSVCVICLSEFVEGERVRILPKCNHGFHVKCIDMWLNSHLSCPTCRQTLSETCQNIIGCHHDHQQASSPSSDQR